MTAYEALYRRWRPKTFAELVGQEHVARTLSNAITGGKLAHAYLFTGPRGTGKTSSARILAKSLNCAQGPTPEPCGTCEPCQAIPRGSFLDVIEIDAASNRKVEDARELLESVRFAPVAGRFKIYIIDEVHMLTSEAFNTLLKTLEEPPKNLIFVLATTDPHKVLPTIISRCQRFDFQRIPMDRLMAHLRHVSAQEKVQVDEAGLQAIARRADGGLRDALSLLDQVIASGTGETLSADDVFRALGILSAESTVNIGRAIADKRVVEALEGLHDLLAAGYDAHAIVRELVELFRHLMLLGLAPNQAEALDIPATQAEALKGIAERFSQAEILYAMEVLRETEGMLRGSTQMALWLEVALMRLCHRDDIPSLVSLSDRVSALEAQLASLATGRVPAGRPEPAPAPRPAAPAPPAAAPAPAPQRAAASSPVSNPATPSAPAASPSAPPPGDTLKAIVAAVNKSRRAVGSLLEQAALFAHRDGSRVVVGLLSSKRVFFDDHDRRSHLERAVHQIFGAGTSLVLEYAESAAQAPAVRQAPPAPAEPAPSEPVASRPDPDSAPEPPPPRVVDVVHPVEPLVEEAFEPEEPRPVEVPAERAAQPNERAVEPNERDLISQAANIFNGRVVDPGP